MEMRKWEATVQEDPDDPEGAVLQFPQEMMEALDWHEGDVLSWDVQEDGSVVMSNLTQDQRQADAESVVASKLVGM